jgi:pyruvate formate lyase activating enzyme
MKKAMFFEKLENEKIKCDLCEHKCVIPPGKKGICRVRENKKGTLYTLVYGKMITNNIEPIEKKPLFHFYPGSRSYSIATVGCNFRCLHCQNWEISQVEEGQIRGKEFTPEEIVKDAVKNGCESISYTYTEPTIFYEYAFDTARISRGKGLKNVFITNGYISSEALGKVSPYLDAANIDLKSMRDIFYRKVCNAQLKPVLDNIKRYYTAGIGIEVTTLIIPGYNDSSEELEDIAKFIKDIDRSIPWHVSRFFPAYRLKSADPTPMETLQRAVEIGREAGLEYVYKGNIGEGENTFCPNCGKVLIKRAGFGLIENKITNNTCPYCGKIIAGKGMARDKY